MPHQNPEVRKLYMKQYNLKRKEKQNLYLKEYRENNKEYFKNYHAAYYKTKRYDKYGLTKEQFLSMLDTQKNKCAICSIEFSNTQRINIDHCHSSGIVRGLLCFHCNTGMGQFKDNVSILKKAIEYLHDKTLSPS